MLAEPQLGGGGEVAGGEVAGEEAGAGGGGDHGGVVGGEGERWEGDAEIAACGFSGEAGAKLSVGGYSPGNENATDRMGFGEAGFGEERLCGGESLFEQIADYGVLEAGDEIEGLRVAGSQSVVKGRVRGRVWAGK